MLTAAIALLTLAGVAADGTTPEEAAEAGAVGVAVPTGVLAAEAPASVAPIKGPPAPAGPAAPLPSDFERRTEQPAVLIGDDAHHSAAFSADPTLSSDHGAPMVRFRPSGPVLPD